MLSRQVLKVCLPDTVIPIERNPGDLTLGPNSPVCGYVHAHVATPYGVTSEIRIPVLREQTSCKCATPVHTTGFSLEKNSLVVNYNVQTDAQKKLSFSAFTPASSVVIASDDPLVQMAPAVEVQFKFTIGGYSENKIPSTPFIVTADKGKFALSQDQLNVIVGEFKRLLGTSPADADPFKAGFTSTEVTVTPLFPDCTPAAPAKKPDEKKDPGKKDDGVCCPCRRGAAQKSSNQLEVQFKGSFLGPVVPNPTGGKQGKQDGQPPNMNPTPPAPAPMPKVMEAPKPNSVIPAGWQRIDGSTGDSTTRE
jgi:hypothetical protein